MPLPIVPRDLVGHVDSVATPSLDPARLGAVEVLAPAAGPLTAWSWTTLHLRYTVGHHGLDDRGGLKIVLRFPYDGGEWQTLDPAAPNFVRLSASRPCTLRARYESFGDARPWFRMFRVQVAGGCLGEGDTVDIVLGDTSAGSPGMRVQSFCEDAWELRVLVDPCATGHFQEVPGGVAFAVAPGPARAWKAVLPGRRPAGAPFWLGLAAEDVGGNPTASSLRPLRLVPSRPVAGLPERLEPWAARAQRVEGLRAEPGPEPLTIALHDAETGALLGTSNPLFLGEPATWWGDLHGQSGETVGINTADAWFFFGREISFLDACAHQANCFQVNQRFWARLEGVAERWHEPGRYVTLHGYEWSGNTAVGGDRNVWYRHPGRPIRRASHALLTDHSDAHTDATTARALFAALTAEERPADVVVAAHVGGRHADLAYAHDPRWERVVEVHSAWGSFEWLLLDALQLGHRVGVVANSDGHKGRPGASYPGAATFGAMGGLTAWQAEALSRDGLVDALRARRTWATSGSRIDLALTVLPEGRTRRWEEDPAVEPGAARVEVPALGLGDIASTTGRRAEVRVRVAAPAGLLSVELMRGAAVVGRVQPWREAGLRPGRRLRLGWEGAEYRGRGRQVSWDGHARLTGMELRRAARFADWSPGRGVAVEEGGELLRWSAVTTGNRGGLDLWWAPRAGEAPRVAVETPHAQLVAGLDVLPEEGIVVEAGGLGKRLCLHALPEEPLPRLWQGSFGVDLLEHAESALWLRVCTEDGHGAWSSPVYLSPEAP